MDKKRAFDTGVTGAAAVIVMMIFARSARITSWNPEVMMGSFITRGIGPSAWFMGLVLILIAGGLCGLLYVRLFHQLPNASNVKSGLALAYLHALVNGVIVLGVMPFIHPLMGTGAAGALKEPGMFGIAYGVPTAVFFWAAHFLYGAVMGAVYHARPSQTVRAAEDCPPEFFPREQNAA